MHEGNFTRQIVDAILDELKSHRGQPPTRVTVKVGEMLHLVPESVRMHYDMLTQDTALQGVRLDLEEVPVVVKCRQCSEAGPVADHHWLACSECGSTDVELVEGNDVVIESIELPHEV